MSEHKNDIQNQISSSNDTESQVSTEKLPYEAKPESLIDTQGKRSMNKVVRILLIVILIPALAFFALVLIAANSDTNELNHPLTVVLPNIWSLLFIIGITNILFNLFKHRTTFRENRLACVLIIIAVFLFSINKPINLAIVKSGEKNGKETISTPKGEVIDTFTVDGLRYKATSTTSNEVAVVGVDADVTTVIIPKEVRNKKITYSVTSIEPIVSTTITSIVIPQSVTTINDSAFSFCKALTRVEIKNTVDTPSGLAIIGRSAFLYSGIASIVIPQSVTTINDSAFSFCLALTKVEIIHTVGTPSKLKTVYMSAFKYGGVDSVGIPPNATRIEE